MTIRQTTSLLILFVFVAFQFSLIVSGNTSKQLNTELIEAFFLVILISLLPMVLTEEHKHPGKVMVALSTAAGLGFYIFLRKIITSSVIDWEILIALISGAGISILSQHAVRKISRASD